MRLVNVTVSRKTCRFASEAGEIQATGYAVFKSVGKVMKCAFIVSPDVTFQSLVVETFRGPLAPFFCPDFLYQASGHLPNCSGCDVVRDKSRVY
jgi:hypothetical protein